jgi:protein-tyrosine phosphatase
MFNRILVVCTGNIPDPYRKSREAFEHVHKLLTQATDAWAARL